MSVRTSRSHCRQNGPLTQLVEYLPFKQRVAGSSPARPTKQQCSGSVWLVAGG